MKKSIILFLLHLLFSPLLGNTVTLEPGDNIADCFLALCAEDVLLVKSGIYTETAELELQLLLEESAQAGIVVTFLPFFCGENTLVLNELMAKNETTIADNYGEYDDWIEITNTGSSDINLSGYYLTDDVEEPFVFAFPDTVISPGEYFIIWADDDTEQGSMHADFKLSADGESIFLLYSLLLVDDITYPELDEDVSFGRWPDGSGEWEILAVATPGTHNEGGGTGIESQETSIMQLLMENPFSSAGIVNLQGNSGFAQLDVYDLNGRLVDSPFQRVIDSSEFFSWDTSALTTGMYLLRFTQNNQTVTRRITIIK